MCKRIVHDVRRSPLPAVQTAYEGETTRLAPPVSEHVARGHRHCGGPWWLLWLIWPLILLVKAAAATAPHIVTTLAVGWGVLALPMQIVGAIALIGIGVVLLRRRHTAKEQPWQP